MPSARAIATYSAVCSLQSPTLVRSTSRADGRLTVGFFSRSPLTYRVSRSARARAPVTPRDGDLGLGDDFRRVALDQRLRRQVPLSVRVGRPARRLAWIANLDDVARRPSGRRPGDPGAERSAPSSRSRSRRTSRGSSMRSVHHRHDRRGLEQVGLHAARHRHGPARVGRLANGDQAQRALLADDLAGVGHPGRRVQAGERPSPRETPGSDVCRRARARACPTSTSPARCAASRDRRSSTGGARPASRPPFASRRDRFSDEHGRFGQLALFGARAGRRRQRRA